MSNFEHLADTLANLSTQPGIYQMKDFQGEILYVGKARNLKRRVSSYFQSRLLSRRIVTMVSKVQDIKTIVTESETDALLLEDRLIKEFSPAFNIMLRDDKTYPWIKLDGERIPAITLYRGPRIQKKDRLFGPFPSVKSVRKAMQQVQGLFKLRNCSDHVFNNRSRPCLEYQIKRCSAPCVKEISDQDYLDDCHRAMKFMRGESKQVREDLAKSMETAAKAMDFEKAAKFRDKIQQMTKLLNQQSIFARTEMDSDVLAATDDPRATVVQVIVRKGHVIDSQLHYPSVPAGTMPKALISAFISQHYLQSTMALPQKILVPFVPAGKAAIEASLLAQHGQRVTIKHRLDNEEKKLLNFATINLKKSSQDQNQRLNVFHRQQKAFSTSVNRTFERVDCIDISHHQGKNAVASCVHYDQNGPVKKLWRWYNISTENAGDDVGSMREVIQRRFNSTRDQVADLLLIDGGKGQVNAVMQELKTCKQQPNMVIGISKGSARVEGMEHLFLIEGNRKLTLNPGLPARHFLQRIRDDAHKFALRGQTKKASVPMKKSSLENIKGVGPQLAKRLLNHFGGIKLLSGASVEELMTVSGVGKQLAIHIHENFQEGLKV